MDVELLSILLGCLFYIGFVINGNLAYFPTVM